MNAFLALTDYRWFIFLASLPRMEEINFWQPGGASVFKALQPGELLLFKLHSPRNFIAGGGFFAHFSQLPVSLAWDAFKEANGAATFEEMRAQIEAYRRGKSTPGEDFRIGCILLSQPFFLPEDEWIPAPKDFAPNIVSGKRYDLTIEPGLSIYRQVQDRLKAALPVPDTLPMHEIPQEKYGAPMEILPRLGQGIFRVVITDAYERHCAVSGEKVLPVLDAAHIRPYAKEGTHNPDNGILLRSDLHTLFDRGYVTVTPDHHFEVSRRVREEFENGHEYYALHGREIFVPKKIVLQPAGENLSWHNENVFKG
jgi:putative restriction endonuclease